MRVRCQGKILRVVQRDAVKNKIGLAVELLAYEYLTEPDNRREIATDFDRISPLHDHPSAQEALSNPLRRG
jgi:hypothetical protein